MRKIMKAIRLLGLVLMILLASIGIGLTGGVPVFSNSRKEDQNEIKIELVETEKEDETTKKSDFKL